MNLGLSERSLYSDVLTWMQDSRPGKLTQGMEFGVESDVEVENAHILHLNLDKWRLLFNTVAKHIGEHIQTKIWFDG